MKINLTESGSNTQKVKLPDFIPMDTHNEIAKSILGTIVPEVLNWVIDMPSQHLSHDYRNLLFLNLKSETDSVKQSFEKAKEGGKEEVKEERDTRANLMWFVQTYLKPSQNNFISGQELKDSFFTAIRTKKEQPENKVPLRSELTRQTGSLYFAEILAHLLAYFFMHPTKVGRPTTKGPRPFGLFGVYHFVIKRLGIPKEHS